MTDAIRRAIVEAARAQGIDPAFALAVAERESSFNPAARNSRTIRGLYQMQGRHRERYGIGDSDDPAEQTRGWVSFIGDVRKEMSGRLGRDPTDAESYLGHHFGGRRAARMMQMAPDTSLDEVFTPREIAENPHFQRAGTVGALNASVLADMGRRMKSHAAAAQTPEPADFASFGRLVGEAPPKAAAAAPADFAHMGRLVERPAAPAPTPAMPPQDALGMTQTAGLQ